MLDQLAEPIRILLVFALGFVPALVLCRLVITLRIMDAPTEARKIQTTAIPSAGGLGFAMATALAVVAVTELTNWSLTSTIFITSGGALAALALGLADDLFRVPAGAKLLSLIAVALGMTVLGVRTDVLEPWPGISFALPVALAVAGSMFWLVVVINAVNFMDGANGVSMGMAAIAAVGLAAASGFIGAWSIALLAGALSGALAGFLILNVQGRLFAGDTGALFAGAILGGLGLELVRLRPDLLFVPPMLLLPYLSDVLLTLAWRGKHGKKLFVAHRDHVYQIAMRAGLKHWQVAAVHAVWGVNAAIVAVVATVVGGQVPAIAFFALLAVSTWVHWKVRRSGVQAGLVGADIA